MDDAENFNIIAGRSEEDEIVPVGENGRHAQSIETRIRRVPVTADAGSVEEAANGLLNGVEDLVGGARILIVW